MGYLNKVKDFSSSVTACSKKWIPKASKKGLKVLKGVCRFSRRFVKAFSEQSESKTPKKKPLPQFMHVTLKVKNSKNWQAKLQKLLNELSAFEDDKAESTEGVRSCIWDDQLGNVQVSGYIDPAIFMKRLKKYIKRGELEIGPQQFVHYRSHLYFKPPPKKPSTSNANPPTNTANPLTSKASQEGLEVRTTDNEIMDKVLGTSKGFKPGRGKLSDTNNPSSPSAARPSASKAGLAKLVVAYNQNMNAIHAQLADKNINIRMPAPLDPGDFMDNDNDAEEDAKKILKKTADLDDE